MSDTWSTARVFKVK